MLRRMAFAMDSGLLAVTAIFTVPSMFEYAKQFSRSSSLQVVYQALSFLVAALCRLGNVPEFAVSTNMILLALLTLAIRNTWYARQILLTSLICIWGVRLVVFVSIRCFVLKERSRRPQLGFTVVWMLQTIWVWVVSLPVTIVNASLYNPPLELRDALGWFLWMTGLVIEMTADRQLMRFVRDNRVPAVATEHGPTTISRWCDRGIWRLSRHPNYFGEILLWWGVFVASTPLLHGAKWGIIVSPLLLTIVLLFVQGVPTLEASANEQHKLNSDYRQYKQQTSPFIPFPPSIYVKLPLRVKQFFFLELPLYNRALD